MNPVPIAVPRPHAYEPRAIHRVGLWSDGGWRLKTYAILERSRSMPTAAQWAALRARCAADLPAPGDQGCEGVGFVLIHACRTVDYIFAVWWANENEMHRRLYSSGLDAPTTFQDLTAGDALGCVWETRVFAFESEAWRTRVMANPAGPDLEAYLAESVEETL